MPSIALFSAHERFPWFRQIPGGGTRIGETRFTLGEADEDCALLVVYDDPGRRIPTRLPRERRLVILSEPPGIKRYQPGFLAQFGLVLGPIVQEHPAGRHILGQPALPWFYGIDFSPDGLIARESFDSLLALPPPSKTEAISVVLSKKSQLPKHRARLKFVEKLQKRLGERLVVFGRGFREIRDKSEAIAPFAYHLVLENNDIPHFWTEKTADALLGWALPIFSGCTNLDEYFDAQAFIPIDIAAEDAACAQMAALLEAAPYASRLAAIGRARERLMSEFNLFPLLERLLNAPEFRASAWREERAEILSNSAFSGWRGFGHSARRLGQVLGKKGAAQA